MMLETPEAAYFFLSCTMPAYNPYIGLENRHRTVETAFGVWILRFGLGDTMFECSSAITSTFSCRLWYMWKPSSVLGVPLLDDEAVRMCLRFVQYINFGRFLLSPRITDFLYLAFPYQYHHPITILQ